MNAKLKPTELRPNDPRHFLPNETEEQRHYRLYESPEAVDHFREKYRDLREEFSEMNEDHR